MGGVLGVVSKLTGLQDLVFGVMDRLKLDPKVRAEIEAKMRENAFEVQKLEIDYATRTIEAVNSTMREEAKSEHWAQWLWRPVVGFTFSATIISNYVLLPYFSKWGLTAISIPGEVWSAMLVILGVAAGTRGYQKIVEAKNGTGK